MPDIAAAIVVRARLLSPLIARRACRIRDARRSRMKAIRVWRLLAGTAVAAAALTVGRWASW